MTPQLAAYLRRIGYGGPLDPGIRTLRMLHRAHLLAISYENIDVLLGERVSLDPADAFEKIVTRKRGGWCYEMNGLFAWALRQLGFDVALLGAAASRTHKGDLAMMNHLSLLVRLEKPYLADVGFGNGFIVPLALEEGSHSDGRFSFSLTRVEDGWWRFTNRPSSGDTFDFQELAYGLEAFEPKNAWLQSSQESPFVRDLVCHRFTDAGVVTLRGTMLTTIIPDEIREERAHSRDRLAEILHSYFDLHPANVDRIWERTRAHPSAAR